MTSLFGPHVGFPARGSGTVSARFGTNQQALAILNRATSLETPQINKNVRAFRQATASRHPRLQGDNT
jgi:hypothetical protein